MVAQKFNGRFLCHSSENFEEYLKGKRWTITQESTFKTISQEFELDKEFEETTADGRKFMTLVTFTPNGKLVQRQRKIKDTDKDCLITRYLEDDDTLVIVIEYGSVTAKRIFKRITS